MTLMNQSQFASHIGKHRSYVTELKHKGLLVMRAGKVDVEQTLIQIENAKDPEKQAVADRHLQNRMEKADTSDSLSYGNSDHISDDNSIGSFNYWRTKNERRKNIDSEREAKVREGELLEANQFGAAVANAATIICNRIDSIPDIWAPQLASETEEHRVRTILFDNIEQLKNEIKRSFEALQK